MIKHIIKHIGYIFRPQSRINDIIDSDAWNLDHSLSMWIIPRLQKLRCSLNGYHPTILTDKELIDSAVADGMKFVIGVDANGINGVMLWGYALDRMIYSFMCVDDLVFLNQCETCRYNYGLDLFRKYFNNLWN